MAERQTEQHESSWTRHIVAAPRMGAQRHSRDAVQLGLGAVGFGISAFLSSPARLSALERQVFVAINKLPGSLYPVLVAVMQAGSFPAVDPAAERSSIEAR